MDLLVVGFLLFWLWALYDVVTVDQTRVRNLPKILWIGIVVVLFVLGALLWVFLGRPARDVRASHPQTPRRPRRAAAPEPESPRDAAQRVVTDRRSAELDRMLDEWERSRGDQGASES
jgi:type VI protein secretion system component VasK